MKAGVLYVLVVLTTALLAGCSTGGSGHRSATSPFRTEARDALASQRDREAYVEANYERLYRSGRFANEAQARAFAAQEWQRTEQGREYPREEYSATWSSTDAAKREQKQLESDLEKNAR